jgi:hypothetical protein
MIYLTEPSLKHTSQSIKLCFYLFFFFFFFFFPLAQFVQRLSLFRFSSSTVVRIQNKAHLFVDLHPRVDTFVDLPDEPLSSSPVLLPQTLNQRIFGVFLLIVDGNRRCLLVNLHRQVVLHRISFKNAMKAVAFSPCRFRIAIAADSKS